MTDSYVDVSGVELCDAANRFLDTKSNSNTRMNYRSSLKKFRVFYDGSLETFVNRVESCRAENRGKPVIERKRLAEDTVRDFIKWLEEKGYSPNSIRSCLTALQNFLKYYQLPISFDFIDRPKSRTLPENRKHQWKLEEVMEFVNSAEYIRDRAIMLCLFQSGLSIGDLVKLDYGDIRRDFEEDRVPLLVDLNRKKTGVDHKTFFGRDAVKYLRTYLASRLPLDDDDPLFTKLGSDERVTDSAIQMMMKRNAEKVNFLDHKDVENGLNPARPHSLRAAFNSRLVGKMDRDLREFLMGHEIGEEKRSYLLMTDKELRELYMNWEHLLAIEKTSREEKKGLANVDKETQKRIEGLEKSIHALSDQNKQLREDFNEFKKALETIRNVLRESGKIS